MRKQTFGVTVQRHFSDGHTKPVTFIQMLQNCLFTNMVTLLLCSKGYFYEAYKAP